MLHPVLRHYSKSSLGKAIVRCNNLLNDSSFSLPILLHMDIKPANIVYSPQTDSISLIAFEHSRFGDIDYGWTQVLLSGTNSFREEYRKYIIPNLTDKNTSLVEANNSKNAHQIEETSLAHCHEIDEQIQNLRELRQHLFNYSRTRKMAEVYRASGYSKQYAAEHKEELRCYREAKKALDLLGRNRLPKISELQDQEHGLIVEKQKHYAAYRRTKVESKQL